MQSLRTAVLDHYVKYNKKKKNLFNFVYFYHRSLQLAKGKTNFFNEKLQNSTLCFLISPEIIEIQH